jgi:acyl-coenzyme A synthetase/AMP-(fatty) acid ligase
VLGKLHGEETMTTLCKLLQGMVSDFGPNTAILIKRGYRTERWSYQYLLEFSERLATYLRKKGFKQGDRMLLLAPNMPEWVGRYLLRLFASWHHLGTSGCA